MKRDKEFDFGNNSVAEAYENYLVPILFEPWAVKLTEAYGSWRGKQVIDLAAGTGVVTKRLQQLVSPDGKVTAIDINSQMLDIAKKNCPEEKGSVSFIEGDAASIDVSDNSIDVVVCQQGFQFFPDKKGAAEEIYRVLKQNGDAVISCWCPVSDCKFFGAICNALELMGENEISDMMRIPFDLMPAEELSNYFKSANFKNVVVSIIELDMILTENIGSVVDLAYSTPIGPKLMALGENQQKEFQSNLINQISNISRKRDNLWPMASLLLSARKLA